MSNLKCGSLSDMMKDFESGVYDFTKNGECSCCGACCTNILPMTKHEVNMISRYIRQNGIKEKRHIIPTVDPTLDMTCPFLDSRREKKCIIYDIRPAICRDFSCRKEGRKNFNGKGKVFDVYNVRDTFYGNDKCKKI